jgi:flagellin
MERLSSGSKINSASDDAAGFAIAERMTAQIRGLNMAAKNAGDGLSMLSAIENATNDVTDMLQRMRELAVQAVNDTNTAQDRDYLQQEVTGLLAEINRVASQTQYNGENILDGSRAGHIQVGTEAGQTVEFSINSIETAKLGELQAGSKLGLVHWHGDDDGSQPGTFAYMYPPSNDLYGEEAAVDFPSFANLKPGDQVFYGLNSDGSDATLHTVSTIDTSEFDAAQGLDEFGVTLVDGNGNSVNPGGLNSSYVFAASRGGLEDINVSTNPTDALATITAAIEQVAGDRAGYGALQNRLDYTVSNLMNVSEFTTAARSRIADADFAAESARLAKAQVLQQSGTAMLAQANASSQLALSLIR